MPGQEWGETQFSGVNRTGPGGRAETLAAGPGEGRQSKFAFLKSL
jgi:hypothetical protein